MAESDSVKDSCFAHFQKAVDVTLSEESYLSCLVNHGGVITYSGD